MGMPLLATKLHIPPPRPGLVLRSRLLERLDAGLDSRLTLISAPAGSGKTTLASEWLRHTGLPVAWLALDRGDNDLVRFLAYLIAALQTVPHLKGAGVGQAATALLQTAGFVAAEVPLAAISPVVFHVEADQAAGLGQVEGEPRALGGAVEELLTGLINEIATAGVTRFVLVLDDYHEIRAPSIHDALLFLLEAMPKNMHLAILTRADPFLPLARLRGRGQLVEMRQADLRFTLDECTAFLNQAMGLGLAAADVTTLVSRTEGWIAGLQMAALALQACALSPGHDAERVSQFIRAFTGSNRYILDYLVEEVLQRQPPTVQAFLLQTCILDRLSGPLCDAVLGRGDLALGDGCTQPQRSVWTLEYLERANLFVVPLDDRREWYRYHRLFDDLLHQRLQQGQPSLIPVLHRRASMWFEANGLMGEAIEHALAGRDLERAADLVEQAAEATLMRSEIATFLAWVEALPAELVHAHASLCLYQAWTFLLSGRPLEAVEDCLRAADEGVAGLATRILALRAWIAALRGQMSRSIELSRRALEQLPESDSFLRSIAVLSLSAAYLVADETVAGLQALEDATRSSRKAGNVMVAVVGLCTLAENYKKRGQLRKAQALFQQALDLAVDGRGQRLPIAGEPLMGLGELAREWNDTAGAVPLLLEGIERRMKVGRGGAMDGYLSLARIRQAQGDSDGALDAIQRAQQLAAEFESTQIDDLVVAMFQALLWVRQGNLEAAARWSEERGLDRDLGQPGPEEGDALLEYRLLKYEHLVLARLRLAQHRPQEALALLEQVLTLAEKMERRGMVIETHALRALAFQAQGDMGQALVALGRALSLAEPEGYVRLFADEGEPMAELLRRYVATAVGGGRTQPPRSAVNRSYAARLLDALLADGRAPQAESPSAPSCLRPGHAQPAALAGSLSGRELEVLRFLTSRLSAGEIAQELVVSTNTVRSHLKSIYGKLDVHSRLEAVERARELNLL